LKVLAKDLENKANKENFIGLIDSLKDDIQNITSAIGHLRGKLKEFAVLLAHDSRCFASLIEKAKTIREGNVEKIMSLQEEIAALNDEMESLNRKIIATASMTGIAAIVFVISVAFMTVATIGFGTVAVLGGALIVGASIGLAGSTVGGALTGVYHQALLEKQQQYTVKNNALQALENVAATAIAIKNQYTPLITTGNKAIEIVRGLFTGWQTITDNFNGLVTQVSEIKHNTDDTDKLQETLDNTNSIIKEIIACIAQHKESGYIQTRIDLPTENVLLPYVARRLGHSKLITLPTSLYAAYVRRMHR